MGQRLRTPSRTTRFWIRARSAWTLLTRVSPTLLVARIFLGLASGDAHDVRLRGTGLRFRVRGRMDLWAVKETVLDRLYERHGFIVRPGWTVIDIGGGIGELGVLAAAQGASVFAFEPHPGSAGLLRENVRRNGAAGVRVFEVAIAGENGAVVLDMEQGDPLFTRSGETGDRAQVAALRVEAWTLGTALDRCGIDRVDLLKLDCEGAEYAILGASSGVLDRIDRIVLEYHDWGGHAHGELVEMLVRAGYAVETWPNPARAEIGYLRAKRPQTAG